MTGRDAGTRQGEGGQKLLNSSSVVSRAHQLAYNVLMRAVSELFLDFILEALAVLFGGVQASRQAGRQAGQRTFVLLIFQLKVATFAFCASETLTFSAETQSSICFGKY